MPTPGEDESQEEFIARCIPIVIEDQELDAEDEEERNQAIAICHSTWREAQEEQGKAGDRKMERKAFAIPSMTMKADGDQGIVETVFAVFGNVDQGGDIIHPGAFSKTFAERGQKVKVLDAHGATGSVRDAIGKPLELRELMRDELPDKILTEYPTATGGALARLQFLMGTPEGKGAFDRIKEGVVDEWSFGYDALDFDYSKTFQDGDEATVRNLRTIKLYEISPVLWGMNPATMTTGAKKAESLWGDTIAIAEEYKNFIEKYRLPPETGGELQIAILNYLQEKAGRVLAQRNANRIISALATIIEVMEDAGLDVPGWTRQPQSQPPEDDEKNKSTDAPATEQAANEGEPPQAGPQDAPTLTERGRLKFLIEIEEAISGGA